VGLFLATIGPSNFSGTASPTACRNWPTAFPLVIMFTGFFAMTES
jgi:hypothetical protein